jgi:hypothetical protein
VRHFAFAVPLPPGGASRVARLTVRGAGEFVERSSTDGIPASADFSGSSSAGVASASVNSAAAAAVSARAVSADMVQLSWDSTRFPAVAVRNAVTGVLLAVGRNGQTTVRTSARELDLLVSDGVKSFVQRVVVR